MGGVPTRQSRQVVVGAVVWGQQTRPGVPPSYSRSPPAAAAAALSKGRVSHNLALTTVLPMQVALDRGRASPPQQRSPTGPPPVEQPAKASAYALAVAVATAVLTALLTAVAVPAPVAQASAEAAGAGRHKRKVYEGSVSDVCRWQDGLVRLAGSSAGEVWRPGEVSSHSAAGARF